MRKNINSLDRDEERTIFIDSDCANSSNIDITDITDINNKHIADRTVPVLCLYWSTAVG